jgi:drug/metabolite transporter (DMT)-like permease
MTPAAIARRNKTRVLLAFAAVYLVWGSTYLFIKWAIVTIPPFLLGGTRFIIAGVILYGIARLRGAAKPTASDWRYGAITGFLMLAMGNGGVSYAQLTVPSGVAALIVSCVPIWIVILDWLRPRGVRPSVAVFLGLALGLIGMVVLIGPRAIIGDGNVDRIGAGVLLLGSIGWAFGSIITRGIQRPSSALAFAGLQMLFGGVAMLALSFMFGEPFRWSPGVMSLRSILSWIYLVLAGSLIGFTAYIYLLNTVSAAKAATYAYVNPIIAVMLGWGFANETIGVRTMVAAAVTLAGVAIITLRQSGHAPTGEYPIYTGEHRRPAAAEPPSLRDGEPPARRAG